MDKEKEGPTYHPIRIYGAWSYYAGSDGKKVEAIKEGLRHIESFPPPEGLEYLGVVPGRFKCGEANLEELVQPTKDGVVVLALGQGDAFELAVCEVLNHRAKCSCVENGD